MKFVKDGKPEHHLEEIGLCLAPLERFLNYIASKLSRIGKEELFSRPFFSSFPQSSHSNPLTIFDKMKENPENDK